MKQKQQLQNCESFELKDARFSRFYDISYMQDILNMLKLHDIQMEKDDYEYVTEGKRSITGWDQSHWSRSNLPPSNLIPVRGIVIYEFW